jgi:hypothetical protein
MAVSFIGGENHRPVASQWKLYLLKMYRVHLTMSRIKTPNLSGDRLIAQVVVPYMHTTTTAPGECQTFNMLQLESQPDKSLWSTYHSCSVWYIFKISFVFITQNIKRKKLNRLNRTKDISILLRWVKSVSPWFITLCLWLYCMQ